MKLGFVFDVRFIKYKDHYYSINLSKELWESRYLPLFDDIVVVGRYVEVNENPEGKFVQSDFEHVTFKCIKDYPGAKRLLHLGEEESFIEDAIRDCDAVICRSWWGVKSCRKLHKNYMIEAIACAWDSYWNHGILGKFVALPAFLSLKIAIKNAPYVLYVTKKFLQRRYPTNVKNAGISDVVLQENCTEEILLNRLKKIKETDRKVVIGTAAAVNVRYKGQENVIRALWLLKKKGISKFEYQMAGNGDTSYLSNIAKECGVEDQVVFLGPIPHSKIFDWYDSLDLYIQPSLMEGLPRSVVEAMSRGLPVIGTNSGGIPELIEEKYTYNRKGKMPKDISEILSSLDITDLNRYAKRNYEFAKEFRSQKLAEQRLQFMKQFASSK